MGASLLALAKYKGSIKPLLVIGQTSGPQALIEREREGREVEHVDKNLLKLGHEATTKHLILTVYN